MAKTEKKAAETQKHLLNLRRTRLGPKKNLDETEKISAESEIRINQMRFTYTNRAASEASPCVRAPVPFAGARIKALQF